MRENTRPSIMQNFDTELAALISKSRGVSLCLLYTSDAADDQ